MSCPKDSQGGTNV
jgi:hypothetical protein